MKEQLRNKWNHLLAGYVLEEAKLEALWNEILAHYTEPHRAYHNLQHLHDLFTKAEAIQDQLHDVPAIHFAIWYHDIIYQSLSKNNEEKSAQLCSKRLQEIACPSDFKEKVFKLIYSTKSHHLEPWDREEEQVDNAYLLDLDLSILGADWPLYELYTQQVRREYRRVPGLLYRRSRKKVLRHFLEMERIFKTDYFFEKYEVQARENVRRELSEKKTQ